MMQKIDDDVHGKLSELQNSVSELDGKIASLDDKVNHVIQMNGEMMVQSSENFRQIKTQMEDQRDKLDYSLRKLQRQTTTKCQMQAAAHRRVAASFRRSIAQKLYMFLPTKRAA